MTPALIAAIADHRPGSQTVDIAPATGTSTVASPALGPTSATHRPITAAAVTVAARTTHRGMTLNRRNTLNTNVRKITSATRAPPAPLRRFPSMSPATIATGAPSMANRVQERPR